MHVGSKTLASVNLKFFEGGKCNLHLPRGLNIGLIKILRSCAYLRNDTRYAQDGRQRRYGVSQS